MDPLYILRDHTVNHKPIVSDGDFIVFQNSLRYPKTTPTCFHNRVKNEPYTLEALYFAYQNADQPPSSYIAACNKIKCPVVSVMDNMELKSFLKGEKDSSPCIVLTSGK